MRRNVRRTRVPTEGRRLRRNAGILDWIQYYIGYYIWNADSAVHAQSSHHCHSVINLTRDLPLLPPSKSWAPRIS